jgi:hypothetical protein
MRNLLAPILITLFPPGPAAAGEHFACNMRALSTGERSRHHELTKTLLAKAAEKAELKNGYGFRLPASELAHAAEWVGLEARCCPFFTFDLEQSRDQGPLWLRITGSQGVKTFIRAELEL